MIPLNCLAAYVGRLLMKETPYKTCFAHEGDQNCQDNYSFVWDDGSVLGSFIQVRYAFEEGSTAGDFKCTILTQKDKLL